MEKDKVTLPPSQQEPSQRDLVAEEDPDPLVSWGWVLAQWLLGMGSVCPACASHVCGVCVHHLSSACCSEESLQPFVLEQRLDHLLSYSLSTGFRTLRQYDNM